MKKGQISVEVMYSFGVMVLIFLLMLGIGFDLRADLRHLDDVLQRKSECSRISTMISETAISSYYTISKTTLKYNTFVYKSGVIEIEGQTGRRITTAATCTFNAHISSFPPLPNSECYKLKPRSGSGGPDVEQTVYILNYQGNVTIGTYPELVTACT